MSLPDHLREQLLSICKTPQNRDMLIEAIETGGGDLTADEIAYDNADSGLSATNLQEAVDELASGSGGGGADIELSNILPDADVDFNAQKLVNVADGSAPTDVAVVGQVVLNTGDQTISDIKTFSSGIVSPSVTAPSDVNIASDDTIGGSNTGKVLIQSGYSGFRKSGDVTFGSGGTNAAVGATGTATLYTGGQDNASSLSRSGLINIESGYTTGSGRSGDIVIQTGQVDNPAILTGDIHIRAGVNNGDATKIGEVIIEFVPDTPSDWSPAPTTVMDALNQLAARIAALEP